MPRLFYESFDGSEAIPPEQAGGTGRSHESKQGPDAEDAPTTTGDEDSKSPTVAFHYPAPGEPIVLSEEMLGPADQESIWQRLPLNPEQRKQLWSEIVGTKAFAEPAPELVSPIALMSQEDFEPESKE